MATLALIFCYAAAVPAYVLGIICIINIRRTFDGWPPDLWIRYNYLLLRWAYGLLIVGLILGLIL